MKYIFLVEGVRVSLSDYLAIKLGYFTLEEYTLTNAVLDGYYDSLPFDLEE
jgi:hypothetical protein